MKYRLCVLGTGGWTDLGTYESDETIFNLDWLLLEQKTKEVVMAIEVRYLNNQDEVRITKQFRKRWNSG